MQNLKRVSLLINEDQHSKINILGLNLSGLVRDLLQDHLSENKITLSVSEETKALYQSVVSNTGSDDQEIEEILRLALKALLKKKIQEMSKLHDGI
jgi:hypothetical protein